MSPSTSTTATTSAPTFADLGVRPLINCMGTYTILSGSRLIGPAAEAMVEASNHYVHMDKLMEKVGQRLAQLTGAEWGYITCGCAAALTQIAAAAMAGADPEKMVRLPDTTGMKDEIIVQKAHRNAYDYAMRMTGAQMVEVETRADLKAAISERTALFLITGDLEERSTIPIPEMIQAGKRYGIPSFVDAAAQRPDVPNRYLQMGADAVGYSGGKCLRGPQSSGLVLGRKDLLKAAFLNGAPHHALGRPMKAGKEEVMGLLAAVEAWIRGRDHEAEWDMWEGYLNRIRSAVADLPSVTCRTEEPGVANVAPTLVISWDPRVLNVDPEEAHTELFEGDPPIAMHLVAHGLRVMPYMMEKGDAEIVGQRLRQVLSDRPPREPEEEKAPVTDLSGVWHIEAEYALGKSRHSVTLEQEGTELTGDYRSQYSRTNVQGSIKGDEISFSTVLGCQANKTTYTYTGTVEDEQTMSGQLDLGEFGEGTWRAERIGSLLP
ncbi:MAG: aminotransferase class V-fold PLP-dependent enzyme [Chloroflexota bacterium]|nr:aminotransferase class V-fold PLP-dependent enzyme [Chloroflexota bacterium]